MGDNQCLCCEGREGPGRRYCRTCPCMLICISCRLAVDELVPEGEQRERREAGGRAVRAKCYECSGDLLEQPLAEPTVVRHPACKLPPPFTDIVLTGPRCLVLFPYALSAACSPSKSCPNPAVEMVTITATGCGKSNPPSASTRGPAGLGYGGLTSSAPRGLPSHYRHLPCWDRAQGWGPCWCWEPRRRC
jgi:hypothetical protein